MTPPDRPAARALAFLVLLALLAWGCGDDLAARRARAEGGLLKRQVSGLRELVHAAETKTLVSPDWVAIGIEESAFREVLSAGLPQETTVAGRAKVRIDRAEVSFQGSTASVNLFGRVSDTRDPDLLADISLQGGLDDIEISPEGRLSARVAIDSFEVARAEAGGAESPLLKVLVDALSAERMERLRDLVPPVEIPVALDQAIAINGLGEGPVQVNPGTLPVQARVARVLALSGRLWVMLDVSVGPWVEATASPGPASPKATTK
jgi:hypothetical protein